MSKPITALFVQAVLALAAVAASAQGVQFNVGDRVHVRSLDDDGTVIEVGVQMVNGGTVLRVQLDKRGVTMPFDSVASGVTPLGARAPTPGVVPQQAMPPPQPIPQQQAIQGAGQCAVGQRVAVPAGYSDKWYQGVVVEVTPGIPYPCRVHPLGYASSENQSYPASMLRDPSAANLPLGPDSSDPYLGQQARATMILPGSYECHVGTGGPLQSAMGENFSILDGSRYRDTNGAFGTYRFDAASGGIVFQGGALNGQTGTYEQPTTPPIKNRPPTVTIRASGDSCDLKM